jgi:putative phage-type endonuclease
MPIDIEDLVHARRFARLEDLVPRSDAWKQARQSGIGGSEAAAILGLSDWSSAYEVYLRKTGLHPDGRDWEGNEASEMGVLLEPVVAHLVEKRTGMRLVMPQYLYQHQHNSWMLGNPDRFGIDPVTGQPCIIEIKTTDAHLEDRWGEEPDEPAAHALIQGLHYAEVLGWSIVYVGVLIGGNRFRCYRIEVDSDLVAGIVEHEADFWDRVQRREEPSASGLERDKDLLNRMWCAVDDKEVLLGEEAVELVRGYNAAHADMKAAECRKNEAGNRLRQLMGDASIAVGIDGKPLATWKAQPQRVLNQERFERESPYLHSTYCEKRDVRVLRPKKRI